jgi:phosphatidylserine/phosphatidylglycerophosphate/cardiolipin synthase-like enzyme
MIEPPVTLLRSLAEGARRRLFLASHIVTDEEVPRILEVARSRGVSVRLFTEVADRSRGKIRIPTRGVDGQYSGDDLARHQEMIRLIARTGVQIQSGPIFSHVKLWVADDTIAATGSVNLTGNSLGTGRTPSIELMQRFEGDTASALAAVARWLWEGSVLMCDYDAHSGFRVTERGGSSVPPPASPNTIVGVPGCGFPILGALCAAIEGASRRITMCTMSAYEWSRLPGLEPALSSALCRGVEVNLVRRTPDVRAPECPSIVQMRQRGLRVIDVPLLHAKGVVIDDGWTAILTGNLNPFSLAGSQLTDHIELAVIDPSGRGALAVARDRLVALAR